MPRFGVFRRSLTTRSVSTDLTLTKTFYYKQTIDHFNYKPESYATFKQMYLVNTINWKPGNFAPIFALLGAEAPLKYYDFGFLADIAPKFGALLVAIEHRYYGKSIPFGITQKEALKNATIRGYFNSAQALADYAEILLHVQKQFKAQDSPIIVFGASYGGMLASWFRLKYPHIAMGALASSAPILSSGNSNIPADALDKRTSELYKETSETCYMKIKESWTEIDRIAAQPSGLDTLSRKFKACKPLKNASVLKDFLHDVYFTAAQHDNPPEDPQLATMCGSIDGAKHGQNILGKIFSAVTLTTDTAKLHGNTCYDLDYTVVDDGWDWQVCSDMVQPFGSVNNDTMFPASPFSLKEYEDNCKSRYGVLPRPHWLATYFGDHGMPAVLKRFGSNIIFSNGLRDPGTIFGFTENISDTIVAVTTKEGSHCLDMGSGSDKDPKWLIKQRDTEVKIIRSWLHKYHHDHM
ncbi:hypothetical protein ACFE04_002435 [Oxalis oulophora]